MVQADSFRDNCLLSIFLQSPISFHKQFQKLRCPKQAPDMANHSTPVRLCPICANKTGLLSPVAMATKSLCQICGCWVPPHANMGKVARLCMTHSKRSAPNLFWCYFCGRMMHGDGGLGDQGVLCLRCSGGMHVNQCCKLLD